MDDQREASGATLVTAVGPPGDLLKSLARIGEKLHLRKIRAQYAQRLRQPPRLSRAGRPPLPDARLRPRGATPRAPLGLLPTLRGIPHEALWPLRRACGTVPPRCVPIPRARAALRRCRAREPPPREDPRLLPAPARRIPGSTCWESHRPTCALFAFVRTGPLGNDAATRRHVYGGECGRSHRWHQNSATRLAMLFGNAHDCAPPRATLPLVSSARFLAGFGQHYRCLRSARTSLSKTNMWYGSVGAAMKPNRS